MWMCHKNELRLRPVIDRHLLQQAIPNGRRGYECRQKSKAESSDGSIAHHVTVVDGKTRLCPNDDVSGGRLKSPVGYAPVGIENTFVLFEILKRMRAPRPAVT